MLTGLFTSSIPTYANNPHFIEAFPVCIPIRVRVGYGVGVGSRVRDRGISYIHTG